MGDNKVFSKPFIHQLDAKTTPVDADTMLLEDSADSWAKKSVLISSLKSAAGLGDVDGPASSTDNAVTRFDGVTGKLLQDSKLTITDAGIASFNSISALTNTIQQVARL